MSQQSSLSGRTALITGATSGIGFHTALALAQRGASVFVTGRDAERGGRAEEALRRSAGHPRVQFLAADCSTVRGNQHLAAQLMARTERLEVLVNNVGGHFNDRRETSDGYEATLAMSFVGPHALTEALLPLLRRSAPARIVNLASAAHVMWKSDPFEDLCSGRTYLSSEVYARAKLLNVLWTFALARRLAGSGVVVNATHPGLAWTSMTEGMAPRSVALWVRPFWPLLRLLQRRGSPEAAARSSVFLASAPEAASLHGTYVECDTRPTPASPAALDFNNQEKAWELAGRLVAAAQQDREASPPAKETESR